MHVDALKILAETPIYLTQKIAKLRDSDPEAPIETLAERVVDELNAGQRWAMACQAVSTHVAAYDRAAVRKIEKGVTRRKPRTPNLAAVESLRQEISEVRRMAEQKAMDLVISLTPELLDSTVSLGDGTDVRIGDATTAQLEARVEMLSRHADGMVGTLARTIALLNLLKASGRETLRAVEVAA